MPIPGAAECSWSATETTFCSRSATTAAGSTRALPIRSTSASSRCALAPPRSEGGSRSRAHGAREWWCGWRSRRRPGATQMAVEPEDSVYVFVVDDHELVRRGLLAFFETEPDLEPVGDVAGGAQALELLGRLDGEGRRPDVVVMDLQMEPIDGIELTRQIRARYGEVEVVALTSFAEDERVQAALEAGASGYLLKDSDPDQLAAAIRAAHRGELQLDPAVARRLMSSLRGP